MNNQTSQPIDHFLEIIADEFIGARRRKPEDKAGLARLANKHIEIRISNSDNPTKTAGEILQKISSLLDPTNNADTQVLLDARKEVGILVANALNRKTKSATTIDFDPKTGKPVTLHGFNPRAYFG